MFTDIRSRLIVSYVIVILVALTVLLATLVLVSRPLQVRLIRIRLTAEVTTLVTTLRRTLPPTPPSRIPSPKQLTAFLDNRLPPLSHRLLVLAPNGEVLFDSRGRWQGHIFHIPLKNRAPLQGQLIGPDGNRYLFAVAPLRPTPADPTKQIMALLIAPYPRTAITFLLELWGGFLVAGLIALFVSVLLGWAIARSIAAPLRDIVLAAEAVARGEYSRQTPVAGPDEVKQLARSFNAMTRQVQATQTAMRDFVSNVSHELKTPLTSIQGFAQALIEGAAQNRTARAHAARIIYDEATRMRRLVEDLLDLARIDAGQITMSKNPINLAALLEAVLNNLSHQAAQKRLQLLKMFDSSLPTVIGNGDRLTQVFVNLLDNAIQHTPPEGTIRVMGELATAPDFDGDGEKRRGVRAEPRFARIAIADSGPGIPADELPRIFERFYQIDKSRKKSQGVGLGLAIAHDIVRAHGGYIRAYSVSGWGTEIVVWLPASEADASAILRRK